MATTFGKVRELIRAFVLDLDDKFKIYSDNALSSQIRAELVLRNASPYGIDDPCYLVTEADREMFNLDLTPQQQAIISLRCAMRLISGNPDSFSYKTPTMSVAKQGQTTQLLMDIEAALNDVLGGRFAITTDDDFTAMVQSYNRFVNVLNSAIFGWPGTPDGVLQSEM